MSRLLPVKIEVCSYLMPDHFAMAVDRWVTHGTKTLIFQCYHCQSERVHRALETLFSLLQIKGIRLKTIVFSKCDVWADDILAFSDALVLKFRRKLHGICDILVLHNVRLCGLPYVDAETCHCISTQKTGFFASDTLDVAADVLVEKCVIAIGNQLQMESALGVLEKGCPPVRPEQFPLLRSRLETGILTTAVVLQVLKQWQAGDPRFARISLATDFPWTKVPLDSLTKLAFFILQWHVADNYPQRSPCHKY
ncbi:uncharacterized protein LOC129596598 [Paramacrobiotus metropolitanus]|uniref:uncharacterized protein LOC129596598 n=1 Tax=Paramacrobiotus metropolitanus TaxID=2943436 RepID=UPI0024465A10|nr:uncharacterized protein LOC129596598 [Paramacrobiotus metropolitanus]